MFPPHFAAAEAAFQRSQQNLSRVVSDFISLSLSTASSYLWSQNSDGATSPPRLCRKHCVAGLEQYPLTRIDSPWYFRSSGGACWKKTKCPHPT